MLRRLLPLVLAAALVALVATSVLLVRSQGRAADLEQELSQEQARVEEQADRIDEQAEQVEELSEQVAVLERSQGPLRDYCDAMNAMASDPMGADDPGVFSAGFEAFDALTDHAPKEVEDDWAVVQQRMSDVEAALAAAGMDLYDLGAMDSDEVAEGVDPDRLAELVTTLEGLDGEDIDAAMGAIERHALRSCGIVLAR